MSYRFADLYPGTKFYLRNDNTVYTVADSFVGAWYGHQRKQLGLNCLVFPFENVRDIANKKVADYKRLAAKFNLTYKELQNGYRELVARTAIRLKHDPIPVPTNEMEINIQNALRYCCLIVQVTDQISRETFEIVSGENNRLYI